MPIASIAASSCDHRTSVCRGSREVKGDIPGNNRLEAKRHFPRNNMANLA